LDDTWAAQRTCQMDGLLASPRLCPYSFTIFIAESE
jgi:hypothetical protein